MSNKFLWLSILAVILSFIGGFLLANALNKSEIDKFQVENTRLKKQKDGEQTAKQQNDLTSEEIDARIKESEENSDDFAFQKGLGLALYRYAGMKQDKELLGKVIPILERAYKINPDDYEVIVSIGNLYYDLGQLKNDSESNLRAREFYKKALDKNSKDANVRRDYGLTFLLTEKPDREIAIKELTKSYEINPKNEKTLIFLSQAYAEVGDSEKAEKYLTELKTINPGNPQIEILQNLITGKNT